MPKISDEKRAARKAQILDAAWRCFQREGLHATSMNDIIREAGLSAGAVYSYFAGKDELIRAAVLGSLEGLRTLTEPILRADPPPAPDELVRRITGMISDFSVRDGYDLRRIALLGWSEAQRDEVLRATMRPFYLGFREGLAQAAERWRTAGLLPGEAAAGDIAKTLLSVILGYVVQSAVIGDVEPGEVAAGLGGL